MKRIKYISPNGIEVEFPDKMFFVEIINKGDKYWQNGSFDAGIEYYDVDVNAFNIKLYSQIILMKLSCSDLFYVQYNDEKGEEYVIRGVGDKNTSAIFYPGGDKYVVPYNILISKEDVLAVCEAFIISGERAKQLVWISLDEL